MATRNELSQNDVEDIPVLTSISPSIFVPTDRDFTKTPPPLSDDPVTRVEATIEELDWHAVRVEENMVAMLVREAERVRRAGRMERVQYDAYRRPVKDQQREMDCELRLEEMILREGDEAVLRILRDERHRESEYAGSSREEPRERQSHNRSHSPASHSSWPRDHRDPEYADLSTLRRERMFRLDVDELRQTPRSAALTHVLNLVKWGWDEQIEGHRAAVKKEKEERRAKLHRQMKEVPFPLATTGPSTSTLPGSAVPAAAPPHDDLGDVDPMDIDID